MKMIKNKVALILALVLLFAAVPPSAARAVADVGYEVLAEYSWNGSFIGSSIYSQNIENGVAAIREEGKGAHLVKYDGSQLVTISGNYDSMGIYDGNFYYPWTDDGVGLMDKDGKELVRPGYNDVTCVDGTGYALFVKWGQETKRFSYAYSTGSLSEITDDEYDAIWRRGRAEARETINDGFYGLGGVYWSAFGDAAGRYWIVDSNKGSAVVDGQNRIVVPFGLYSGLYFYGGDIVWATNQDWDTGMTTLYILRIYGGEPTGEYVYNVPDDGAGVDELIEGLADDVVTEQDAVDAVNGLLDQMTYDQKDSETGIDLATLLAETAAARTTAKAVQGNELIINAANVIPLVEKSVSTLDAVEAALESSYITTHRYMSRTVIFTTGETGELTVKIDPDVLTTEVDKVRIETPDYALTFKMSDLEESLTGVLTFTARSDAAGAADANAARAYTANAAVASRRSVTLMMPDGITGVPVTMSFDSTKDASAGQAIRSTAGTVATSKYNPATGTLDGKVNESGTYTTYDSEKDFTDISGKSQEMQTAIKYLASKGVINGTTDTTFSPDKTISRSEVAALLVRAIGKLNNNATTGFTDVKTSDWYYTAAASSQKCGLIKGYDDNTFKGLNAIAKHESVAVAARTLMIEMNYKVPDEADWYLRRYSDTVPTWARPEVALATKENLVVYRVDGTFSGSKPVTRGDAAILIYRLFQKMW